MTTQFQYSVAKGEPVTHFLYRPLTVKPIKTPNVTMSGEPSNTEDYYEVEYPVRKYFLEHLQSDDEIPLLTQGFSEIYTPFERDKVDFSTALATPHVISTYLTTTFSVPYRQDALFQVITCGRVIIWVNGEKQVGFAPYTRNHGQSKNVTLSLAEGENEFVIYMDDLAERDVNFYFMMISLSELPLIGEIDLPIPVTQYAEGVQFLQAAALDRDFYTEGAIELIYPQSAVKHDLDLRVVLNPKVSLTPDDVLDGNITEFKMPDIDITVRSQTTKTELCQVKTLLTASLSKFRLILPLSNKYELFRDFECAVYDQQKLGSVVTVASLSDRKQQAADYFSSLSLGDINVALTRVIQGKMQEGEIDNYRDAFNLIENKGDCADFPLAPLLATYSRYHENFPNDFDQLVRRLALDFRYWIDEPGDDVMWYFSENHALLFNVSQYFAGHTFSEDTFTVSGRTGAEQYRIGKQRIIQWFDNFKKYGFSEWNSITYIPIDLIGFFALYNAAPDPEIKQLAKEALDFTFRVIALNMHDGIVSSTFGRVYEHNLKTMQLGELTSLTAIAWQKGCFNNALRAAAPFAISDYQPPADLNQYLQLNASQALQVQYAQGNKRVLTYQYRTQAYSLAGAINYWAGRHGHQQHVQNISLGSRTFLWINNPGEAEYSGEGRPSYWAGNSVLPQIYQYRNIQSIYYDLTTTRYKFVHLYLPIWTLDEVVEKGQWLFIRRGRAYLAVYSPQTGTLTKEGKLQNREVIYRGPTVTLLVKCGSKEEFGSFERFQQLTSAPVTLVIAGCDYRDSQWGDIHVRTDGMTVNGDKVDYSDHTIAGAGFMNVREVVK